MKHSQIIFKTMLILFITNSFCTPQKHQNVDSLIATYESSEREKPLSELTYIMQEIFQQGIKHKAVTSPDPQQITPILISKKSPEYKLTSKQNIDEAKKAFLYLLKKGIKEFKLRAGIELYKLLDSTNQDDLILKARILEIFLEMVKDTTISVDLRLRVMEQITKINDKNTIKEALSFLILDENINIDYKARALTTHFLYHFRDIHPREVIELYQKIAASNNISTQLIHLLCTEIYNNFDIDTVIATFQYIIDSNTSPQINKEYAMEEIQKALNKKTALLKAAQATNS